MTRWAYQFALMLALPWLIIDAWCRYFRAPESHRLPWAQFGRVAKDLPTGCVWLHAVSLGEIRAAAPLIRALQSRWPGVPLVVSTMTETGAQAARELGVRHFYAPFDYAFAQRAVIRRLRPKLIVVMETELWPNWAQVAEAHGVPMAVVNARLSDRSFRRYRRWGGALLRQTLNRISLICTQSQDDQVRFRALAPAAMHERIIDCGNIKFDVAQPEVVLWSAGARTVWLAASTHDGEESVVLDAHQQILVQHPDALLVLAPRHPERAQTVQSLISSRGLVMQRSSMGLTVDTKTQVLLVDQTGLLMQFFAAIEVIFMGGSLVMTGGHNPIEPAVFGRAVLSGPNVHNFRAVYRLLRERDAVRMVKDEADVVAALEAALEAAWAQPEAWRQAGVRAHAVVQANRGSTARVVDALDRIYRGVERV
jgi:3-deoxy-D-manno-octulosonic-acid transferase